MPRKILVTGGAGFVGSHLVDELVARGHEVRVLDNLDPQVHANTGRPRGYTNPDAEFILADVRDATAVDRALDGVDAVFHLAAAVGVAQSMYQIRHYVDANSLGGATLLQSLCDRKHRPEKLIVASSMSIYGEGAYRCDACGPVSPSLRSRAQMRAGLWEMLCPRCGTTVKPTPTAEDKPLAPTSIYAVTKRDHEDMFLCFGNSYGIPTVALRFFNIYGVRQSLSNPYTGAAAIFSSRLLNDNPPLIFEDGRQMRDLIHVSDIVAANLLALERGGENGGEVFNVGTGRATSILELATLVREGLGRGPEPQVLGKFREGDIRHCYADISRIRERLGFVPKVSLEEGMMDLMTWVREQHAVDLAAKATSELEARGLTT
jgi:dTDP-L-rhamnose 4-epimerase